MRSWVLEALLVLFVLAVFNLDDNVARYLGQFGAEVVKGFSTGGVP